MNPTEQFLRKGLLYLFATSFRLDPYYYWVRATDQYLFSIYLDRPPGALWKQKPA